MKVPRYCAMVCAVALLFAAALRADDAMLPPSLSPPVAPLVRATDDPSLNYFVAPVAKSGGVPQAPPVNFALFDQSKPGAKDQTALAVQPADSGTSKPNAENKKPADKSSRWHTVQATFRQFAPQPNGTTTEAMPGSPLGTHVDPPGSPINAPTNAPSSVRVETSSPGTGVPSNMPLSNDARTYLPADSPYLSDSAPGCPSCHPGSDGDCGCGCNGSPAAANGGMGPSRPGGCGDPRGCSCVLERFACCLCKPYPDCSNGCMDFCHSWIFHEDECWLFTNHKCCAPWCGPYRYGNCPTDGTGNGNGNGCGCGGNPAECVPPPDLYFTAEALTLTRNNTAFPQTVVEAGGTPVLSTNDFPFDWEVGPKFVLGWRPTRCDAWEITYFGLLDFDSTNTVTGAANLSVPGGVGGITGFASADTMNVTYSSNVHNAEFNYLWNHGCNLTWLMGFRYFQLTEDYDIDSLILPTANSLYDTHTVNNLYGGQIGVRSGGRWGRWGWDCTAKAGAFGNHISDEQNITDSTGTSFRNSAFQAEHWAFIGDVGLNASYYICKNWSVRAGYNLMWVDGVALAPDQLDFTNTPTSGTTFLNHNGNIFYQGFNAGFGCRW